ncbi:MAG: response regulator transcription factor [Planctomycetia bacterium]|nr:response regulator transcription factor [Planctomycetia bacterium]
MVEGATRKKRSRKPMQLVAGDPHPAILLGLAEIFKGSEFRLWKTATRLAEVREQMARGYPEILLLEKTFPEGESFPLSQELRHEGYEGLLILYTDSCDETTCAKATASGMNGFLHKRQSAGQFLDELRSLVASGRSKWISTMARRMYNASPREGLAALTPRENQVLRHITLGLSNKEIAASLGLGFNTVKEHVAHILHKLKVADRTQAAVLAIRQEQLGTKRRETTSNDPAQPPASVEESEAQPAVGG